MDTFGYDRILVPTDMSEFAKLGVLGMPSCSRNGSELRSR